MDETIEEEMSQDMEKGFSVLGTAFGVFLRPAFVLTPTNG